MSKLIYQDELVNLIFPLGVPAHDWDYCISARAIYDAIMKCQVIEHEEVQKTLVENLGLPDTAIRAFRYAGKTTVWDVLEMDRRWLLSLRRIGPKTADEIIEILEQQGYDCTRLKTEEDRRLVKLREIKERGYAPKVEEGT